MEKLRLIIALALLALLGGCKSPVTPDEGEKPDIPAPADYSEYTSVPLTGTLTGVQPMTGIVLWTDNDHLETDCIQLEYSYLRYNDICSQKDVYNWDVVEKLLNAVSKRGHQAVIRFYYTYVGKQCTVPDYIKALPDYEETVGKSEGKKTYFPDWRNSELQRFHLEFYRRLAERYDHDPRLAFLETGFGLWAEYHIYDGPYILGKTFPSKEFQAEWIQKMDTWFTDTPWCISIDAADYGPFDKKPDLLSGRFGNFDDSFMCEEHDEENLPNWQFFGKERYKKAPLGGEFSYYTDYDQEHCLDKKGIHGRTFEAEAARFHLTFIIGNDQPDYQSMARIKEASLATGYRFCIRDFRIKEGKGAAVLIENTGVAPIYRDAWVEVEGVRSTYNLRNLMPGEQQWVPVDTPSASPSSVPAIACDHLVKGQRIGFDVY